MILNLGVGVGGAAAAEGEQQAAEEEGGEEVQDDGGEGGEQAPVNGDGHNHDGMDVDGEGQAEGGEGAEEAAEIPEEDYGALALLDTVIEEREERLSNEDVAAILAIIRETLGGQAPIET
jgi:cobalamin biosynthesis protein CobT